MNREQQRSAAGIAVHKAIREGTLHKPTNCSKCKSRPAPKHLHAHHFDYNKPLEVVWLCQKCHKEVHRFLNWFRNCVGWLEFCQREGTDPKEATLPAQHAKTGAPLRENYFRYWLRKQRPGMKLERNVQNDKPDWSCPEVRAKYFGKGDQ